MKTKIYYLTILLFVIANVYGCAPTIVGTSGESTSTSVWANGKLAQAIAKPIDEITLAAKSALKNLGLPIIQTTIKKEMIQLRSVYTNGKKIWIDVEKIEDNYSKIEIRVGIIGDKEASTKILNAVNENI